VYLGSQFLAISNLVVIFSLFLSGNSFSNIDKNFPLRLYGEMKLAI